MHLPLTDIHEIYAQSVAQCIIAIPPIAYLCQQTQMSLALFSCVLWLLVNCSQIPQYMPPLGFSTHIIKCKDMCYELSLGMQLVLSA